MTEIDRADEKNNTEGGQLLDDIQAFLSRFIAYPSECHAHAHTLWIAHCWFMDSWDSTPRIAFLSPEPGSGKTRGLELTDPLVPRPCHSINSTAAYLFRKVCDPLGRPTILYDEVDTLFGPKAREHEDVRGLINAGHRKGATAGRCVVVGKKVETEELPAYCAVALAGLDDLPDTIMTRSVVIRMKRRRPDERVEPWRRRVNGPEAQNLYRRLMDWSNTATPLDNGWPEMPAGIEDRDADVWEALIAVADLAESHWPTTARTAAQKLVAESRDQRPTLGVQLLRDLRQVFADDARMPTSDILIALNKIEEAPWSTISKGEPLTARGLAQRLSKYGISPRNERIGTQVLKGYVRAEFADAWERYLGAASADVAAPEPDSVADVAQVALFAETGESESVAPVARVAQFAQTDAEDDYRRPGCICIRLPRPCDYCVMAARNQKAGVK